MAEKELELSSWMDEFNVEAWDEIFLRSQGSEIGKAGIHVCWKIGEKMMVIKFAEEDLHVAEDGSKSSKFC